MSEWVVDLNGELGMALAVACAGAGFAREKIVRCRDCTRFIPKGAYRFNNGMTNKDACEIIRGFVEQVNPNGFCAWGERK